jgi:hypothetical protein
MSRPPSLPPVTLVGYPFRSTGRAEHIRASWRALSRPLRGDRGGRKKERSQAASGDATRIAADVAR